MIDQSLNKMFEASFRRNWDRKALANYGGEEISYRELSERIARLHIFFRECGLVEGDKISICSRNQINWATAFLAAMTYGAVPVPILHEFKPANVAYLVGHSDSRLFFVSDTIWDSMTDIPSGGELVAVVSLNDFSVLHKNLSSVPSSLKAVERLYSRKYPKGLSKYELNYHNDIPSELAIINYTSGTSGFSKGVMLPYRSLISNVLFAAEVEDQMGSHSRMVSILPTAHMYGLLFEFLFEMTIGAEVFFLQKLPSPKILLSAMADVRPDMVISVPMVIEKIYKKQLQPYISKTHVKMLLNLPGTDQMMKKKMSQSLVDAFGGRFKEVIIGGAAFNREAEQFLKEIGFPFTIGYGMTECGPIIAYAPWNEVKLNSCGKAAPRMEIMINSEDSRNVPGEIFVRGDNLFLGYYKNEQATEDAFTVSGWFKTGDLGVIDEDGYLFIKGRNKSMILGPSGQNIYPEEIESLLNNMPYVAESLVIEDDGNIVGLVYPDFDRVVADGLSRPQLEEKLNDVMSAVNQNLPNYCKLSSMEIFPEEFEKTPKKSIKRYLYQRN